MRLAFIVGSNGPEAIRLNWASSDATRVADALKAPQCAFEVTVAAPGATAQQIRNQLVDLIVKCQRGDTFVFYFSGHGDLEHGQLFLLLDESGGNEEYIRSALYVPDLLALLRFCKAESKLVILDCCNAGAGAEGVGVKDTLAPELELGVPSDNFLLLLASARLERAKELQRYESGFLTWHLVAALGDERAAATEGRGQLSVEDLRLWLQRRAVIYNQGRPKEQQVAIPYLVGQARGNFFLTLPRDRWEPYPLPFPGALQPVIILPIAPQAERAYFIGKYPVTNREYVTMIPEATLEGDYYDVKAAAWRHFQPLKSRAFQHPDQPVVCASYADGLSFMQALSKQTPVEVQWGFPSSRLWDFAAFATEYPRRQPSTWLAVSTAICDARAAHGNLFPSKMEFDGRTRCNAYGVSDMIGNVWEWCVDRYKRDRYGDYSRRFAYSDTSDRGNDRFKFTLQGGSFSDDLSRDSIYLEDEQLRDRENTQHFNVGFRVAGSVALSLLPAEIVERLEAHEPFGAGETTVSTASDESGP